MTLYCLALLALLVSTALGDEVAMVRVGEGWRYFKGVGEPSTLERAWCGLDFDDSGWLEGRSGFTSCNYGYEATDLPDMPQNYLSVYLRKRFRLDDPSAVKWLVLRVDYDDGFVAYLNGTEIARRGLAGEVDTRVPFDAPAVPHRAGFAEEIDVSAFIPCLQAGENLLAIQAHNASLAYDRFVITPELLANFTRGPFLGEVASDHLKIIWKTPVAADSVVEFGSDPGLGRVVQSSVLTTNHVVTLTSLAPDTVYYYRVSSSDGFQTAVAPVATFRSLKAEGPIHFVVFGDSGTGVAAQYELAEVIRREEPELVLHTGDIGYPALTQGMIDLRCFSPYGAHMRSTPYYFSAGNHDLYFDYTPGVYVEALFLPTNSVTGNDLYYSFDHGNAHFVVLYEPLLYFYTLTAGDPQYQWLTNDLAASSKPWKFLMFHVAFHSSSYHRDDDYNGNGTPDRIELRDLILPVAQRYGVQLIFTGHEHSLERFNPSHGVHTVTTAGGGASLYAMVERDVASCQFWRRYHCVRVHVDDDSLLLEALDTTGAVFDWMTIQRTPPPAQTWAAAWHSPVISSGAADDFDGNVTGQLFDFAGTPIPTLPGEFSNLGRFYVNNDGANLYIGIEQAMFYPSDNMFVFIASPRLSGVTNLVGLGNGIIDPMGQGADGLDCLENLQFDNFAPSIACVLGDEFADGQFRSFLRPGAVLNSGQGVFHLDMNLTDVPGAQVQQFNRSPQVAGEVGEQNANFIEVAIPLSELGGLQPGDVIQLGAVVGGAAFDPARQSRALDTSYLGTSLSGSGQAAVILGGVSVRMADAPPPELRLRLARVDHNRFVLSWPAVVGRAYDVEVAETSPVHFARVGDSEFPRRATSTNETYELDLKPPLPVARYFRVRQLP
jgi:hypothetical protein